MPLFTPLLQFHVLYRFFRFSFAIVLLANKINFYFCFYYSWERLKEYIFGRLENSEKVCSYRTIKLQLMQGYAGLLVIGTQIISHDMIKWSNHMSVSWSCFMVVTCVYLQVSSSYKFELTWLASNIPELGKVSSWENYSFDLPTYENCKSAGNIPWITARIVYWTLHLNLKDLSFLDLNNKEWIHL